MLKKCLKHEWKATWKSMAGINGAALILGLFGGLGIIGLLNNMRIPDVIVVLYTFAYVVILIASAIVTYLLMASRYYKSIFTDEGYLTNTLPLTSDQKILSKFLIFFFWSLINIICISGSIALLIAPMLSEALEQTNGTADILMRELEFAFTSIAHELGFANLPMMVIFLIAISLISLMYTIMMIYTCISLGNLFSSHKILATVLIYFGLNMILQAAISGITVIDVLLRAESSAVFSLTMLIYALIELALSVVFYFINRFIIDKKLNLQ